MKFIENLKGNSHRRRKTHTHTQNRACGACPDRQVGFHTSPHGGAEYGVMLVRPSVYKISTARQPKTRKIEKVWRPGDFFQRLGMLRVIIKKSATSHESMSGGMKKFPIHLLQTIRKQSLMLPLGVYCVSLTVGPAPRVQLVPTVRSVFSQVDQGILNVVSWASVDKIFRARQPKTRKIEKVWRPGDFFSVQVCSTTSEKNVGHHAGVSLHG